MTASPLFVWKHQFKITSHALLWGSIFRQYANAKDNFTLARSPPRQPTAATPPQVGALGEDLLSLASLASFPTIRVGALI